MIDTDFLISKIGQFTAHNKFARKGPLCVAIVVTQHAKNLGLPLSADKLLTEGGGQVLGLGKSAVQNVLARHGIEKTLAAEGGRTSRGSVANMREYVAFLNELEILGGVDLNVIEDFWIKMVEKYFSAKPFKIKVDGSKSLRSVVRDIIQQARQRQSGSGGMQYVGGMLQHLVGAKLDCALGAGCFTHNGFSVSDAQTARTGDFMIGDVAIHVTTSPGEAVVTRCKQNLDDGFRPILITLQKGLLVAEALCEDQGIADRVDIFEIEQFIALNLHEFSRFAAVGRRVAVADLINRYNDLIDDFETDPSMRIDISR